MKYRIFAPNADDGKNSNAKGVYGHFYVNGNYMEGKGENWDWSGINIDNKNNSAMTVSAIKSATEFDASPVATHSAEVAFEKVLAYVGASYRRDTVDARVTREAREGTYTHKGSKLGGLGIIDSQKDVGGWPELKSETRPKDSNNDGIPDEWAAANMPEGASQKTKHESGYTYLELYINSLVEHIMRAGVADAENTPYNDFGDADGIQYVQLEAPKVQRVEYYNLSGVRQDAPQSGFNIIRYILTDGSVKSEKVYLR